MKLTRILIRRCAIGLSFLVALAACDKLGNKEIDPNDAGSMGEWQVTEFSGSITNERTGGGDPQLCPYFIETYTPVRGNDDTYIHFQDREGPPDLTKLPPDVYDTQKVVDEGGVFIFHFGFDNGYHGNESLDGSGVQYYFSDFIPGSWTFSVGVWTKEGVEGEIKMGNNSGGYSTFLVKGSFVGTDRIEGTWRWEEKTAWSVIPQECNTEAEGSGLWTAERK